MTIPKKWATRRTEPGGRDSYFRTKNEAILKAQALLVLGIKRVVHIARFDGVAWIKGAPNRWVDVETWGIVEGVIRRTR